MLVRLPREKGALLIEDSAQMGRTTERALSRRGGRLQRPLADADWSFDWEQLTYALKDDESRRWSSRRSRVKADRLEKEQR